MKNRIPAFLIGLLTLVIWIGCSDENPVVNPSDVDNKEKIEKTVLVVLPMNEEMKPQWDYTFLMLSTNIKKAFENQDVEVVIDWEFRDESSEDIDALANEILKRGDEEIYAVIGGLYSSKAKSLASALCRHEMTFFTVATTEELIRSFASSGNLWAMTETDITQCEVLLSKVVNYGGESVALIADSETLYGKTFTDWFGFQAKELGLEVKGIFSYHDSSVEEKSVEAANSQADFVICAPSSIDDLGIIIDTFNSNPSRSRMLVSDMGYGPNILAKLGKKVEGMEGVAVGADPETGFDVSFKTFFGIDAGTSSSQVYDAGMLLCYSAWYQHLHPDCSLKEALRKIVDGRDFNLGSWMGEDMRNVVDALGEGSEPYVRGASGWLDFDSKVYTNVLASVYYNYKVYDGRYIILDYNTADGGNRTDATLAGWNWKASQMQEFDNREGTVRYGQLTSNKALLVASSSGWDNYRHQADILAIYQLLKSNGYDDDDIILIMEDDIAFNGSNPQPGTIRINSAGENIYNDVIVDYQMSELKPEDILDLIAGKTIREGKPSLDGDDGTNLLIFWSGHGNLLTESYMCWGDFSESINGKGMYEALEFRNSQRNYRKVAMFVETCYSGGVMQECLGIPGMLFMTAANPLETSKADIFDNEFGVWLSNRFTSTFIESVTSNPDISLKDLYNRLFLNTVGSHVMLYNNDMFGNIYNNTMREFLVPVN